ncbi:MAG: DNA-processing protein DprA [candidate division KSB1 bacterium]|nr:DNA-processing protein DprA [candidate division KSB1 bacterium]MDZ7377736.1 DNA-processing protein DprA [candidate division KSB1 bacterium]MDZ7392369.1 DNA-processing protein DprA [candidate division KSB1 bacterium]MDZ7412117.1 DNA-processing protein DprA [candidate division KSB1 bacterium]
MKIDVEALLRLSAVPGVGPSRLRALVGRFQSPEAVFRASIADLVSVEGIDKVIARNIRAYRDDGFAREQLSRLNRHGASIVTFWDAHYPRLLKSISDPPAFLFVRGTLRVEDNQAVAVVGTRSPTEYGRLVAARICAELSAQGVTIVSGLARGIDTEAHKATLQAGGRTIAVLGSGVDVIYPPENRSLAKRIIEQGALVSELPMGAGPDAPNFPRRNRLISGMTLGTLVVEAGDTSGALITANVALEQNREVFAVPGGIFSPKSRGTNRLIQEGAKLVMCPEDVLAELRPQLPSLAREARRQETGPALTDLEKKVLASLSAEPTHIDVISKTNGLAPAQTLTVLLSLELKDLVRQLAGKMFVRTQ